MSIYKWMLLVMLSGFVACGDGNSDESLARPDALGEFGVGHTTFTAVDSARDDRPLLMDVWYPTDTVADPTVADVSYALSPLFGLESDIAVSEAPVSNRSEQTLLVFSHGYGGIHLQAIELMETLASHGFIVASAEHTGNAQASNTDSFDVAASNRVPDVSFVIDTMLARNADSADLFFGRIRSEGVGVLGHSFGGMTTLGSVAGWAGAPADPRVAAIAPMSAVIQADLQQTERTSPHAGFTPEQLQGIEVPAMLIGGTLDEDVWIENNEVGFERMTSAPSLYKVDIAGATHTHFTNVCTIGSMLIELGLTRDMWPTIGAADLEVPYEDTCSEGAFPVSEVNRLLNVYVVSFFRHHLLGHTGYQQYLTQDYAEGEPAIELTLR
ncbi:MAG: hypothetical protein VX834_06575 [Myxococcota bacterium]|nr:hypothetical protein [Myxococcota bacterium]